MDKRKCVVLALIGFVLSLAQVPLPHASQETGAIAAEIEIEGVSSETLREKLVKQVESQGIHDEKVLAALKKVPRHEFIPERYRKESYRNHPVPIGMDQTISQPFIVGYMTQMLELKGDEKVLEIGTGSGYQAAILAEIVKEVYTIEILAPLGRRAKKILGKMGYENIFVKVGDGYKGWPEYADFDAIIVTAAPGHIPQPLVDQLKVGGRMVIPVGNMFQKLMLITKDESGVTTKEDLPVVFVPMTGEAQRK